MYIPEIDISTDNALTLDSFKEMDYHAVNKFDLPIELMMENAGLHLASLVAQSLDGEERKILIGVGNGNNGGGGLVAARRLAAWGHMVFLDMFTDIDKPLPKKQLDRALKFGVSSKSISDPDIWVDAYLGFSQRLPLSESLEKRIATANTLDCIKISLDIPTGFLGEVHRPYFQANKVISLAAGKKILYGLPNSTELYVADIGIPAAVYEKFKINTLPFQIGRLLKIKRT